MKVNAKSRINAQVDQWNVSNCHEICPNYIEIVTSSHFISTLKKVEKLRQSFWVTFQLKKAGKTSEH